MAADNYGQDDGSGYDPEAEVRRRILAQQGGEPSAPSAPAAPAAAASDPIAPAPFQAQPAEAQTPAYETPPPEQGGVAAPPNTSASAPGPAPGNDANQIQGWYSQWLGRTASEAEIQSHLGNPGGLGAVMNLIANSPEAQAYAASHRPPTTKVTDNPKPPGGGGGGTGSPVTNPTTAQTFGSVNSSTLPSNPFQDLIRQQILERLKAAQAPVDPNAPEITAALTGSQAQLDRQQKLQRTQTAERLYGQNQGGLNTDALTRNIQQSNERNATSLGTLRATLIMNAFNQKRTELQDLLQLAVSSGDADSARMVQLQLAALSAQVQREGIGSNLAIAGQNNNNITVGSAA